MHTPLGRLLRRTLSQAHNDNLLERTDAAPPVSRRQFIGTGLAAGAASLFASCTTFRGKHDPAQKIAIIGGGTSGLSAAYKLQKAGIQSEIFEASPRFGGRMWTKKNFNDDQQFCEIGGELIDSRHTSIKGLAKDLGLTVQNLKTDDVAHLEDLYQVGGVLRRHAEVIRAFKPLAAQIAADHDKVGKDNTFANKLDNTSLAAYLRGLHGKAEQWIFKVLEMAYVPEMGEELEGQSALNLVELIGTAPDTFEVFGDSDEGFRIQGGNEGVPIALTSYLAPKIAMNLGHRLVRIEDKNGRIHLTFEHDKTTKTVVFDKIITTLPFPQLKKVSGVDKLALTPEKRRVINEYRLGANTKRMCSFTERYWNRNDLHLPAPANGSVYSDTGFQNCWDTSRGQAGARGILTNFTGGNTARSGRKVQHFITELDTVFKGIKSKYEGKTIEMNWFAHKYTQGNYTMPAPGQFLTFAETGSRPELGNRLHFAGEQTSRDSGGFMDGAVESGLRAAEAIIRGA